MTEGKRCGKIGRLSQDGTLANGSLPTQIKNRIEGNELKQTTNTKVFMNKMFLSIYFLREYIVTYISQKNSQQKTKKTLEQSETPEGAEGFKQLN